MRYAMAIAMSLKDINTNPAAFKDWASKWFAGMPGDIFDRSFEINSQIFFTDSLPKQALFDLNVSFLNTVQKTMNAAPLPASLTFASLYDPSVAQDALKRV